MTPAPKGWLLSTQSIKRSSTLAKRIRYLPAPLKLGVLRAQIVFSAVRQTAQCAFARVQVPRCMEAVSAARQLEHQLPLRSVDLDLAFQHEIADPVLSGARVTPFRSFRCVVAHKIGDQLGAERRRDLPAESGAGSEATRFVTRPRLFRSVGSAGHRSSKRRRLPIAARRDFGDQIGGLVIVVVHNPPFGHDLAGACAES